MSSARKRSAIQKAANETGQMRHRMMLAEHHSAVIFKATEAVIKKYSWVSVEDKLPPDETPVLIVINGKIRIGERRWDHPGHEDTYESYWYWDDPENDGQGWETESVTHWATLIDLPTAGAPK